jgi:hypothetical protein
LIFCIHNTPSFGLPNKFNLQVCALIVPSFSIGIPFQNEDSFQLGYSTFTFWNNTYANAVLIYSKQITRSENRRSAVNLGIMFSHLQETHGGGVLPARDSVVPVLLLEQENAICNSFSWLFNLGFPNLIGVGLKWYI